MILVTCWTASQGNATKMFDAFLRVWWNKHGSMTSYFLGPEHNITGLRGLQNWSCRGEPSISCRGKPSILYLHSVRKGFCPRSSSVWNDHVDPIQKYQLFIEIEDPETDSSAWHGIVSHCCLWERRCVESADTLSLKVSSHGLMKAQQRSFDLWWHHATAPECVSVTNHVLFHVKNTFCVPWCGFGGLAHNN